MKTHKVCTTCNETRPLEDFYKDSRRRDGHRAGCKYCQNKWQKQYRDSKPEAYRQRSRDYYYSHKDTLAQRFKEYYRSFREWYLEYHRAYHSENVDDIRDRKRKYISEHRDNYNAYYAKRRSKKKGNGGSFTGKEWKELCQKYGNRCLMCGRDDVKLTADHIVPVSLGGSNNIDNIQPLCQRCNSRKLNRVLDLRR